MTALRPHEVRKMLVTIEVLLGEIIEDYYYVHGAAYGPARAGDKLEGRKHHGDPSDPTGSAAVSVEREHLRRAMIHVTDTMNDAVAKLEETKADLKSARYTIAKAQRDREPMPSPVGRAMVTRAELAESRAAKVRRDERGERWGEG